MAERVAAAGPASAVLSSDCGVFVLPSPPEGLREFLLLLREAGIAESDLRRMVNETPKRLFRCGQHDRDGSFEPAPLPEATQGDGGGCRSIRR